PESARLQYHVVTAWVTTANVCLRHPRELSTLVLVRIGSDWHVFARASAPWPRVDKARPEEGENWRWWQPGSKLSQHSNSLITGKITGNFENSGLPAGFLCPIGQRIQWLPVKFPTQRNREFLEVLTGNSHARTGNFNRGREIQPRNPWHHVLDERSWRTGRVGLT